MPFAISDTNLQITILVLGSIVLIFSVVAAKVHHRWAFAVVLFATIIQLGLNFILIDKNRARDREFREQQSSAQKAFASSQEAVANSQKALAEEHDQRLQERNELAEALAMISRQQKMIESLSNQFASEHHSKDQLTLVNEQLKTEKERYDGLISQYNAQLDQLARGLISKAHFDACNAERGHIGQVFNVANIWKDRVASPTPRFVPDPDYAEEARKAQFQGISTLSVVIMPSGITCDIKVVKPLGKGLDEAAIRGVSRWIFEPAKKDGKPVAFFMEVQVDFHLY